MSEQPHEIDCVSDALHLLRRQISERTLALMATRGCDAVMAYIQAVSNFAAQEHPLVLDVPEDAAIVDAAELPY